MADAEKNEAVTAYLGLGANLGDPALSIQEAILKLNERSGIKLRQVSSYYRTAPIGLTDQPDFINAVARIETLLSPDELLAATLHIENLFGRTRTKRWGPRVIDIDVLLYGGTTVSTPTLTVPHPRMLERAFVLVPLLEVSPDITIPGSDNGEALTEIAARLSSETRIIRVS